MNDKISLSISGNQKMNCAMQQNRLPLVAAVTMKNETEENLSDLKIVFTFEPEFAYAYTLDVAALGAGKSVRISPVPIKMNTQYLFDRTERVLANMTVRVTSGEEELYSQVHTIEVLAYDEWPGTSLYPEVTAAFVMPNDPSLAEIINEAGRILNTWTGSPSFTAYQTQDPNAVLKQAAAVYAALQKQNIAYIVPPASFESEGQRVRLAGKILKDHRGTCFDLSLLYLSVLEAIGLRGVLILMKGHSFVGCFLQDRSFPEAVQDDASAITKRFATGIDEMCVLECTDFTAGKNVDFDMAMQHGKNHFASQEIFHAAIDITAARKAGVRPLALTGEDVTEGSTAYDGQAGSSSAPEGINVTKQGVAAGERNLTKQGVWERKLLDLSLRNPLLSFRPGRSSMQLLVTDPDRLEDGLQNKTSFKLLCKPDALKDISSEEKFINIEKNRERFEPIEAEEYSNKRIRTFLTEDQLETTGKAICRAAKNSLEENSVSTLYLAVGFLKWISQDKKERYAPLILLPVDLVRKNTVKSFEMKMRDEDAVMNVTLLEFLRQNFSIDIGGLDPLPQDESGADNRMVFNTVRQAVMEREGWDVEELCFLGQFSFGRFIMWNDIRNRSEDLKKNKVVSSLMNGSLTWTPIEDLPTPDTMDEDMNPAEMAIPLTVDSSQLTAVASAAKGESFVLHGPPGTGKSQTITNMIANALYQGKSVLFVAEKMAALSVVQKRLSKIGLGPFCLEMHSNKTQKRAILDQFAQTLEIGRRKEPEDYVETSGRLYELRRELNGVMKELHRKQGCGLSLYELITIYENSVDQAGRFTFDMAAISQAGPGCLEEYRSLLERIRIAMSECDPEDEKTLRLVELDEFYPGLTKQLMAASGEYKLTVLSLMQQAMNCKEAFGILSVSRKSLDVIAGLIDRITRAGALLPGAFASRNLPMYDEQIRSYLTAAAAVQSPAAALAGVFDMQAITGLDAARLLADWRDSFSKGIFSRGSVQSNLINALKRYAHNPSLVSKDTMETQLNHIIAYNRHASQLTPPGPEMLQILGSIGPETDYVSLLASYEASADLWKFVTAEVSETVEYESIFARLGAVSTSLPAFREENSIIFGMFQTSYAAFATAEEEYMSKYKVRLDRLKDSGDYLSAVLAEVGGIEAGQYDLRKHASFMALYKEADATGLQSYLNAYRAGEIEGEDLIPCMECNLSYALIAHAIRESEILRCFDGPQFEQTIQNYKDTIARFETLTVQELVARLSSQIPATSAQLAGSSELGMLQKAIKSGGRGQSIRKLFDSIPTLLRRLKPCMLMSPLSVAQYIDPNQPKFDLIIFDEASQLPTAEAVGSIARAENCIVVGDPKQLPPTAFFQTQSVDEEHYEQEDLESLLDDCLALSMPQEHLLWHYRSRHESLIAYSNTRFYEHKLYTFPSPDNLVSKVRLVHVDGYYERSGAKVNRAEAEAVVEEILRRLRDEQLRKQSIGVVTFSLVQQNLVEDLLMEKLAADPELDRIAGELSEPIFIKNLENVQGDERDVILFSICYGPDKEGKVTMNFGPVNREGGWRRLNVAITRSRTEMIVFATIRPEQIDPSKTISDGVAGLKGFLEFAEKGTEVLERNEFADPAAKYREKDDNRLLDKIASDIEGLGYTVDTLVGSSEYKIDMAIRHPEKEGVYILGILCDGNNYKASKTARDRNISQPSVLKGLGWNLMHIWTLDYLNDPDRVIGDVEGKLQILLSGGSIEEAGSAPAGKVVVFEKEVVEDYVNRKPYIKATLQQTGSGVQIYEPASINKIVADINEVILREAPISRTFLYKRVLSAWQITRLTDKSRQLLDDITMKMHIRFTTKDGVDYIWRVDQSPLSYAGYRVPLDDETRRDLDEICTEEIASAVMDVVKSQISLTREDIARETGRLFGFTRVSETITRCVDAAVDLCVEKGALKDTGGRISE